MVHKDGSALKASHSVSTEQTGALLTDAMLARAYDAALAHWERAGAAAHQIQTLHNVDVLAANLEGDTLGLTSNTTNLIWIDRDAAGYGWSVTAGGMDLLTVVSHELGHALGYEHGAHEHDVMADTLPICTRRLPSAAPLITHDRMESIFASPLLPHETRWNVTRPVLAVDAILASDPQRDTAVDHDTLLLPLSAANSIHRQHSSSEAIRFRVFNDIAYEEVELLDEDLLALIAQCQQ